MNFFRKNKNSHSLVFIIAMALIITLIIAYFLKNKLSEKDNDYLKLNPEKETAQKNGSKDEEVLLAMPKEASEAIRSKDYTLLDIRSSEEFEKIHIESSQNIPYQKDLQDFSDLNKSKVFIIIEKTPSQNGLEIARKMIDKGFEVRCLEGGLERYITEGFPVVSQGNINSTTDRAKTNQITKQEILEKLQKKEKLIFLDVRKEEDYQKSHVKNSINIPLENLEKKKRDLPSGQKIILDENPERSFQAAVRLFDMNILNTFYYPENLQNLKEEASEKSPETTESKDNKNADSE